MLEVVETIAGVMIVSGVFGLAFGFFTLFTEESLKR